MTNPDVLAILNIAYLDPEISYLDLVLPLELDPQAVNARLGWTREKRYFALLAVLRITFIRVRMDKGLSIS
jgi:hypothetical protein